MKSHDTALEEDSNVILTVFSDATADIPNGWNHAATNPKEDSSQFRSYEATFRGIFQACPTSMPARPKTQKAERGWKSQSSERQPVSDEK
tara:strand:+ start:11392 stop:11661 length:270 start_codon:yes stop_codon:yes gene_type:complete